MIESLIGSRVEVFIGLGVLIGWAAAMTGIALANSWLAVWRVYLYCGLLALAWRFLSFALFKQPLLLLSALLIEIFILISVGLLAYRITHVRKMVKQYPWLYKMQGLFSYAEISEENVET